MKTSISNSEIRTALRTQLLTVGVLPLKDYRAWENKLFEPTKGEPWIRDTLLYGDERITANNEKQAVGIYQVDYFVPMDEGTHDAEDVADAIKNAFKPTTVLDSFVRIERSYIQRGSQQNAPWHQISVLIDYKTFSTN